MDIFTHALIGVAAASPCLIVAPTLVSALIETRLPGVGFLLRQHRSRNDTGHSGSLSLVPDVRCGAIRSSRTH